MNKYEIMFIVKTTIDEATVKETANSLKSVITTLKGKITEDRELGRKDLAYPIKKEISGFYYVFKCEANPKATEEFERKARLNENVLRHLIIKLDEE
ncbi:MAG: 30S ribosomal protein S6 [Bacilli bacterium]|nr:30S ribosomal protein S6 [Bacilli bacterium]